MATLNLNDLEERVWQKLDRKALPGAHLTIIGDALNGYRKEVEAALTERQAECERLRAEVTRLQYQVNRCFDDANDLKRDWATAEHEIEQTLGRALGYPKYADDQKNFPGAAEADGVCVGEHVAVTLAAEIAGRLVKAEQDAARYRWLKDSVVGYLDTVLGREWSFCLEPVLVGATLDEAIDTEATARAALTPKPDKTPKTSDF